MARLARGGLRVAFLGGHAVDTRDKALHFIAVALGAHAGNQRGGRLRVVGRTVATSACIRARAQRRVHALGQIGGFIGVTSRAVHFRNSRRMWKLLDVGVALRATNNRMNARLVLGLVYENTLAACRLQIFLPVARHTIRVGIARVFRLGVSCENEGINYNEGAYEQRPAPHRAKSTARQFAPRRPN